MESFESFENERIHEVWTPFFVVQQSARGWYAPPGVGLSVFGERGWL
jgi:hypothetical protein